MLVVFIITFAVTGDWGRLAPYVRYYDVMNFKTLLFLLFTNVALFGQDLTIFLGMNTDSGGIFFTTSHHLTTGLRFRKFLLVPIAWTLGVELIFYTIAPFIVRRATSFILAIIAASFFIRFFTYLYFSPQEPWVGHFFPSELALFLLGTISYKMYRWLQNNEFSKKGQYIIAVVFYAVLLFYQFLPLKKVLASHLINWLFYLLTCLSLPVVFQLSKSSRFDSRIGELSYPIYISHLLVILTIRPFITRFALQAYAGELSILFTIIFAYILMKAISDPIEKIRQARVRAAYHA